MVTRTAPCPSRLVRECPASWLELRSEKLQCLGGVSLELKFSQEAAGSRWSWKRRFLRLQSALAIRMSPRWCVCGYKGPLSLFRRCHSTAVFETRELARKVIRYILSFHKSIIHVLQDSAFVRLSFYKDQHCYYLHPIIYLQPFDL